MQVRLLGPVDVVADGGPRPVPGLRRMAVLATLALRCGEVVSTGQLADVVWGEAAPTTAVNTLQSHAALFRPWSAPALPRSASAVRGELPHGPPRSC
jgi:DNA-binding SARP family transcriptional activator